MRLHEMNWMQVEDYLRAEVVYAVTHEGARHLDDVLARPPGTTRAVIQDGRKAALISFDVTSDGFRPVPRAHLGLIAGGLAMSLESDVPQGATVLSAFSPMSFAGLASSLAIWLLSGDQLGPQPWPKSRSSCVAREKTVML